MNEKSRVPTSSSPPQPPPPSYGSPATPPHQVQSPQVPGYGPLQGFVPPADAPPYPIQPGSFVYQQQMGYGPPPLQTPGQDQPQQASYGPPSGPPPQGSMAGYPPQSAPRNLSVGAQYQEQLLAMCASGNHDYETRHGIAGIIGAVVCFPIGLLCLLIDVEKRCVRCGARAG